MGRGNVVHVRGHALVRNGQGQPWRSVDGRAWCACGWSTDPGLTWTLVMSAHRDHKLSLVDR